MVYLLWRSLLPKLSSKFKLSLWILAILTFCLLVRLRLRQISSPTPDDAEVTTTTQLTPGHPVQSSGGQSVNNHSSDDPSAQDDQDQDSAPKFPGYLFQPCNCTKHKGRRGVPEAELRLRSTCSEEADWVGPGQKVLSYSLHNDSRAGADPFDWFTGGLGSNIYQARQLYPGWLLRIHSDQELGTELCAVACKDQVIWCDARNFSQVNFRVWRFLPLGDPTVDVFVSRDLDGYISEREREAVGAWEDSNKAFHLTRDKKQSHGRMPMMAGMWGAKNSAIPANTSGDLRQQFLQKATRDKSDYTKDEKLLKELIFDKYEGEILAHDSYFCKKWPKSATPFPRRRRHLLSRVGESIRAQHLLLAEPCPVQCRPSYGKKWTYC